MKRHYVLDENVLISAQTGIDAYGQPSPTCLLLLLAIEANCHSLILTSGIWRQYSVQIERIRRAGLPLVPRIMAIFKSLVANSDKDCRWISDKELSRQRSSISLDCVKPDDQEFVLAAASVNGSILVTSDGPLLTCLEEGGVPSAASFTVRRPERALADIPTET